MWRTWGISIEIIDCRVLEWVSRKRKEDKGSLRLFLPNYVNMDVLLNDLPKINSKKFCDRSFLMYYTVHNLDLRRLLYRKNKATYLAIDHHIKHKLLRKHKHCITRFIDLYKEEGKEFPEICPYAYAYVFWRRSILQLDKFYRTNSRSNDIDPPNRKYDFATKLIGDDLVYMIEEYIKQKMDTNGASESALIWILNRLTAQFCIRYFYEWLRIAEDGARNEKTPYWTEVEKMKINSFPKIAFEYDESITSSQVKCFLSVDRKSNGVDLLELSCPNISLRTRRNSKNMRSTTPELTNVLVYGNPCIENKELQQYVSKFVSKFR